MNREIKFRGKRADNGQWVEGFYCGDHPFLNYSFIVVGSVEYQVETGSVAQFTGSINKNGEEIYEGSIIYCQDEDLYGVVEFDVKSCKYIVRQQKNIDVSLYRWILDNPEVKGNIYENSELIKNVSV